MEGLQIILFGFKQEEGRHNRQTGFQLPQSRVTQFYPSVTMDPEHEELEDKLISNRVLLTKRLQPLPILDYLYQERFLNDDEMAEIKCDPKHPSRREKIGVLLDIIRLKGADGIRCFLNRVGWEYENTYRDIMKCDPPAPPRDFRASRESQVLDGSYTPHQPDKDSESIMKLYNMCKEDIEVLEKGHETLKKENEKLKAENKDLRDKRNLGIHGLFVRNDNLQTELTKALQDSNFQMKERDEYRKKWEATQMELNNYKKKDSPLSERPSIPPKPSIIVSPRIRAPVESVTNMQTIEVQLEIKSQQLDEERQKCEELSQHLNKSQEENEKLNRQLKRKEERVAILKKERDDLSDSKNKYFEQIIALEERLKEAEREKLELFKKQHNAECKIDKLSQEVEQLKNEMRLSQVSISSCSSEDFDIQPVQAPVDNFYDNSSVNIYDNRPGNANVWKANTLPSVIEQRKPNFRHNTLTGTNPPERLSDMSTNVTFNVASYKQRVNIQPSNPYEENVHQVFKYIANFGGEENTETNLSSSRRSDESGELQRCTSETSKSEASCKTDDDNCQAMNFEVSTRMLASSLNRLSRGTINGEFINVEGVTSAKLSGIKITGGNFTGIFIEDLSGGFNTSLDCLVQNRELMRGDQLHSITYASETGILKKVIKGSTLDKATRLLNRLSTSKKDLQFEVRVRRSHTEYESAKTWMKENGGYGDFFYVRVRCPVEEKVKAGEIVLVRNTLPTDNWEGLMVDRVNGNKSSELVLIPKIKQTDDMPFHRSHHRAIRNRHYRDGYIKVLPMKAKSNLPVMLLGPSDLVDAVLCVLREDASDKFIVAEAGAIQLGANTIQAAEMSGKHAVFKGQFSAPHKDFDAYIVILLAVPTATKLVHLRRVLGKTVEEFSVEPHEKEYLEKNGIVFDIVMLPSDQVKDKSTLIEMLSSCVSVAQHRQFWLSADQLDSVTREKHSNLLDIPKTLVTSSSSQSLSQDEQSMDDPVYSSLPVLRQDSQASLATSLD
ncbi:hypothetical protein ScPMuIL_004193 [Solemya velum]